MSTKSDTVLVTGASSGIGLDIAKAFYAKGSNVVLNGRKLGPNGNGEFWHAPFSDFDYDRWGLTISARAFHGWPLGLMFLDQGNARHVSGLKSTTLKMFQTRDDGLPTADEASPIHERIEGGELSFAAPAPGLYGYFCNMHVVDGMMGAIVVRWKEPT